MATMFQAAIECQWIDENPAMPNGLLGLPKWTLYYQGHLNNIVDNLCHAITFGFAPGLDDQPDISD